jgi:uncharacterized protein (DUF885 family)
MKRLAPTVLACLMFLGGCGAQRAEVAAPAAEPKALEGGRAVDGASDAFDAAVDRLTRSYFEHVPEAATYNGAPGVLAPGADARLNDRSVAGEAARVAELEERLAELKAMPVDALGADDRRTHATLVTLFDGALGPSRVVDYGSSFDVYGIWFLPYVIAQNSGVTLDVTKLLEAQQAVRNADDAREYLARLERFPAMLDGTLAKMRHDVALGAIPPDFIVRKSKAVVDAFTAIPPAENVLVASFAKKLDAAKVADADAHKAKALALIETGVLPAFRRVSAYLGEIAPQAPHDAGVWRLPNGPALYRAMVRHMTDSDLDPEEVHRIGLAEVARITAEMDRLLRAQGLTAGTVGERLVALAADPRYVFPNTPEGKAQLLASIEMQMAQMTALLPRLFGTLPRHRVELRRVPEFSQDSAPGGYYDPPAPDGSRPGIYWVNLRDTAALPKFSAPTLTFHEAIPGHHMQVAIAIDQDAPFLAKSFNSNAAAEGWALYAEALAAEMGMYADDPIGDIGRLRDELHRAVRLVVDTGMHAKQWSREKAIDYVVAVEGADRNGAVSEVERYVVWPGQALGYKIGMLRIQQLRKEAEVAYGDRFDIREFHDRLLRISASALPVIERDMRAWIAEADASP